MWAEKRVGVVVPAYNEQRLLRATLERIPEFVDRVIVVDDASTDGTWKVVSEQLASVEPRLIALRHATNQGVGAAIVSGYHRAIAEGLDWVAVMAGDNQMDPSELSTLLEATSNAEGQLLPVDYVKGNRFLHPSSRRMPLARRLGSRALSWLTRRCTGLRVDDCQCGYTLIRVSAAAELPLSSLWPRYGYPNDLLALLARYRKRVVEVPVAPIYRDEASGLHAGHVLSIAYRILRRWASQRRAPPPPQTRPDSARAEELVNL